MKKPRIFRLEAKKSKTLDILVYADSKEKANSSFRTAVIKGEIGDDSWVSSESIKIARCNSVVLDETVIGEIFDYGIITGDGNLIYPKKEDGFIESIKNKSAAQEKEEWLKKYHLEFNFAK